MEPGQVGGRAGADEAAAGGHHRPCEEETQHGDKHIEVMYTSQKFGMPIQPYLSLLIFFFDHFHLF